MGELPDLSSASLGSVSLANTPRREKQQNKKAPLPRLFVFLLSCCVFCALISSFPQPSSLFVHTRNHGSLCWQVEGRPWHVGVYEPKAAEQALTNEDYDSSVDLWSI